MEAKQSLHKQAENIESTLKDLKQSGIRYLSLYRKLKKSVSMFTEAAKTAASDQFQNCLLYTSDAADE